MNSKKYLIILLTLVLIGLVCVNVYSSPTDAKKEQPIQNIIQNDELPENFYKLIKDDSEKPSPYDWIKESQIKVYNSMVVINIKNSEWASFTNTNSMDPVIDYGTNAIQIIPESENDIHIGDIVSYRSEITEDIIIHRVLDIGNDSKGWYMITKGDNNENKDPEKIRFNQIDRVVVAIIY